MSDKTPADILEKAAELFETNRYDLAQNGYYTRTEAGGADDYATGDSPICAVCALGAIEAAASDCTVFVPETFELRAGGLADLASRTLRAHVRREHGIGVPGWNDDFRTNKDGVIHALHAATQEYIESEVAA